VWLLFSVGLGCFPNTHACTHTADYFECYRVFASQLPKLTTWRPVVIVVERVMDCLTDRYTPAEVLIGTDARFFLPVLRMVPAWVADRIVGAAAAWTLPKPAALRRGWTIIGGGGGDGIDQSAACGRVPPRQAI
jgi:hypothetical protein